MKAVRIDSYGGVDVLVYGDAPRPTPGNDEVLIRAFATSVNPFDCALRAGYMSGYVKPNFPLILGTDVAGVVEEVGADVKAFQPGDSVYGRGGVTRDGAYAGFVVVPAGDVACKPQSLDYLQAAALPHVSLTAWQALVELADVAAGQTVLIHGAAGGVGHIAVQLAKCRGAKVIGTMSQHRDLLRELGVDEIIDYSTTLFEDVAPKVDVVLDTVGGDTQQRSWRLVKPGGILVSVIEPPAQETADAFGVRQAMVFSTPPIGKVLTELAALVDSGQIKPHLASVFPLEEVQAAHRLIEARHTGGKIALQITH